ncbi:putative cyclin-D6-1 [Olea europaea var. sylvestris]|uniref:Cyclin-D6-1 n=1 Tax=Olea europaea subsp. europaea TaxID=158383 RepID=A0A8S0RLZ8_OLEEU|nr:putative cyclin-D6-1 [Olea europaea var. sylvestris]CAA2980652.1 cyclin-D6-1 [Olea europaea subsp. europaea]
MEFEFEFDLENPLPTSDALFLIETDHMPSKSFLEETDLHVAVRRETISLVLHFSQNSDPFSSYLAVNYLDRFISTQSTLEGKPWILRLLAISCVSLALKMRKKEFSVTDIQNDGGIIFDSHTIERMELLILGALKWRMRSISPFSFIHFFISLFKFKDQPSRQALKNRATEIILKAQNDIKLLEFKPSIISASALLCAAHEWFPLQFSSFRNAICSCSYVNKNSLLNCYNLMQEIAMDGYESVLDMGSSSFTPVNVLDLQCSSTSSSTVFADHKQ